MTRMAGVGGTASGSNGLLLPRLGRFQALFQSGHHIDHGSACGAGSGVITFPFCLASMSCFRRARNSS